MRRIAIAAALPLLAAPGGCFTEGASGPSRSATPDADASTGASEGSTYVDAGLGSDATAGDAAKSDDATSLLDGSASVDSALAGWTLVWSDEFDGPDGSAVDPTKWTHDTGGNGWGNSELEYYTDGTQNAVVSGGNLVITATDAAASQLQCSYGTCRFTSARLLTKGLFALQYGRFEARIQIPFGQGIWPAFWMLGSNIDQVSWPACGEIDIMENIGKEPSTNHGSLHAPGFPGAGLTGKYVLANGAKLSDAFHTYAAEWDSAAIRFYVDDQLYETQAPSNVPAGGTWAFDHPFFVLLNVAVGGTFPGNPDGTTTFPQTMKVDWVRVYQRDAADP
jgi:beta-glucanase (GH16 family)